MKILLSDHIIETSIEIEQGVQVVHYSGQTSSELCEEIKQLAIEPFDLAIVVNNKLANIIFFFEELSELKSISFYGDNFIFTKKYIEYFNLLQNDLAINVYYTGRRGVLRNILDSDVNLSDVPPAFFVAPFATPSNNTTNDNLFNNCNQDCWKDKEYFRNATPNTSYKLNGNLTIDYTGHYINPIYIGGGAIFDGCGHTITLNSDVPLSDPDGTGVFEGLFNLQNGSVLNTTIKVNTKYVTLATDAGWLCMSKSVSKNNNKIDCLIDNCHVYANLSGNRQGGLVGFKSFNNNGANSKFTIQNCSFTGNIDGDGCGGIVGENSFRDNPNATIIVENCRFVGGVLTAVGVVA